MENTIARCRIVLLSAFTPVAVSLDPSHPRLLAALAQGGGASGIDGCALGALTVHLGFALLAYGLLVHGAGSPATIGAVTTEVS